MMTGVEIIQVSLKGWAPVWVMETIADLSMMTNFTAVSQGIIDIRNIFYFVSLISLSLAVNTKIIELKKV